MMNPESSSAPNFTGGIPFAPSKFASAIGWTTKKKKKRKKKKRKLLSEESADSIANLTPSTAPSKPSDSNQNIHNNTEEESEENQSIPSYSSVNKSMDSESDGPFYSNTTNPKKIKKSSPFHKNNHHNELLSTYGGGYTLEEHEQIKEQHREELLQHCPPSSLLSTKEYYKQQHKNNNPPNPSSSNLKKKLNKETFLDENLLRTKYETKQVNSNLDEEYSILTLLQPNDCVTIVGMAQIEIIQGDIEILGYHLRSRLPTTSTETSNNNQNNQNIQTKPSNKTVKIYSPSWMSTLTLRNTTTPLTTTQKCHFNDSNSLSSSSCKIKLSSISWEDHHPHIQNPLPLPSKTSSFQILDPFFNDNKAFPITIPPAWENAATLICSSLQGSYTGKDEDRKDTISPRISNQIEFEPKDILPTDKINTADNLDTLSLPKAPRIIICGATHVGKSTCVRYVINRILSNFESIKSSKNKKKEVMVMDCDVGQPEFHPSGLVSLLRISEPIFSPPHVHMMMLKDNQIKQNTSNQKSQIWDSYFFGETSSKADPTLYTTLIDKLMHSYESYNQTNDLLDLDSLVDEQEQEDTDSTTIPPLIVNTDGWVKGMGAEILTTIIDIVQPTHIIQIKGHNKAKQFDLPAYSIPKYCQVYSVPTFQRGQNQLMAKSLSFHDDDQRENNYYEHRNLPKIMNNAGHAKSIHLRALRLCTYFMGGASYLHTIPHLEFASSGFLDRNGIFASTIAKQCPYAVSFDDVQFCTTVEETRDLLRLDEQRRDGYVLDGLNGSIVALCSNTTSNDRENHSASDRSNTIPRCLGLGLVRSIDKRRRLFYILTPVSPQTLEHVNCLLGGGKLTLPSEFHSPVGKGSCSSFPYQCYDDLMIGMVGSNGIKSRGHGDS